MLCDPESEFRLGGREKTKGKHNMGWGKKKKSVRNVIYTTEIIPRASSAPYFKFKRSRKMLQNVFYKLDKINNI